ncbi:TetR/AcrR family transcriptional regulator [Actinoplanes sp. NPDC026670]|uniref:TetR/AcrR family transcriptional regulator n=1 Tax=Actinoplanes sp. NPDC026670 TaxID=3154700 RepID=UPI0033EBC8D4
MTETPITVRRPQRADARRNFDALLAAARDAFAANGADTSLEEIAKKAGVGVGTLYRNFPTRQDLIEAVYVEEVTRLSDAAAAVADQPPWPALRAWLGRFVDYVATKRAIIDLLNRDSEMFGACRAVMYSAGEPLFDRAKQAGEIRADAAFDDVLRLVSGLSSAAFVDDDQRRRVLDIALDGLRAHR